MIPVQCPACGHGHQFPDALAKMVMMCRECGQGLPLTRASEAVTTHPVPPATPVTPVPATPPPPPDPLLPRLRAGIATAPQAPLDEPPTPLDRPYDRFDKPIAAAVFPDYELPPRPMVPAGRWSRFGARFIDRLLMLGAAFVVVFLLEPTIESSRDDQFVAAGLLGMALVAVPQIILLSLRSQSIGKVLLGIQIVHHETGEPVGFLRAVLLREGPNALIGFIPRLGGMYNLIDVLFIFGAEQRCLHDYIAGTRVVSIR